eukprot:COSAG06_NODE_34097_length_479_cov_3.597368_2_plen_42_part_01
MAVLCRSELLRDALQLACSSPLAVSCTNPADGSAVTGANTAP